MAHLQAKLADARDANEQLDRTLDTDLAMERLKRLEQVLAGGNVVAGNTELSLHIEGIRAFADGRVAMRASKLGVFEGIAHRLARGSDKQVVAAGGGNYRVQLRRRGKRRLDDPACDASLAQGQQSGAADADPFAGPDGSWFCEEPLEIQEETCWSEEHAAEVAALRAENVAHWTAARLAEHFGVTPPTIRKSLRSVLGIPSGSLSPGRAYTAKRIEDHRQIADQAAELYHRGTTAKAIAEQLGISRATVDKALDHWYEQRGRERPDGRGRNRPASSRPSTGPQPV